MIEFNCACGLGGDDGSDAVCCLKCLKWFHKRCADFEEDHLIYLCTRCLPPDPTWLRPGGEGERRKFWIALDFWRVAVRRNVYWAENYDDDTPTPDDFRVPEDDYDNCLALFERSEKPYMYVRLKSAATAPRTEYDNISSNSIMDNKSSSNVLAVSLVDQLSRHTPESNFTVYKKTSGDLLTQSPQHRQAYMHDSPPPVELVDDIEQITAALEKVHNFQRISHKNQLSENYIQHKPAFTKKIMPKARQINELYNLSTNY